MYTRVVLNRLNLALNLVLLSIVVVKSRTPNRAEKSKKQDVKWLRNMTPKAHRGWLYASPEAATSPSRLGSADGACWSRMTARQ